MARGKERADLVSAPGCANALHLAAQGDTAPVAGMPSRKQFQSCDQCRHSRKACDAAALGITLETLDRAPTGNGKQSCSACHRRGRDCSFTWLLAQSTARSKASGAARLRPRVAVRSRVADGTASDYMSTASDYAGFSAMQVYQDGAGLSGSPATPAAGYGNVFADPSVPNAWMNPTGALSAFGSEPHLANSHLRNGISDALLAIYQSKLEQMLAYWSNSTTCPYSAAMQPAEAVSRQSDRFMAFYQRASRMDKLLPLLSRNHSSSGAVGRVAVKEALHKVMLAFASQWGGLLSSKPSSRAIHGSPLDAPGSTSDGFTENGVSFSDSLLQDLDRVVQTTLWHEARRSLQQAGGYESFRLVLAQLIFSFTDDPRDVRSYDLPRSKAVALLSGPASESVHQNGWQRWSQEPVSLPRAQPDAKPPSYNPSLPGQANASHLILETSLRELLSWKSKIDHMSRRGVLSTEMQRDLAAFREDFRVLYWLGVMCDTTSSAITGRQFVIADEQCAAPSLDESMNVPLGQHRKVSVLGIPSSREQQSIWDTYLITKDKSRQPKAEIWCLSEVDIANKLLRAIPIKVLLFRKVASLSVPCSRSTASFPDIEGAVKRAAGVYHHWQQHYAGFIDNCINHHHELSSNLQSWYVVLAAHWHYGALLLAEKLAQLESTIGFDASFAFPSKSAGHAADLSRDNALAIARIACACLQLPSPDPIMPSPSSPPAILNEPWCDIMVRSLGTASDVLLDQMMQELSSLASQSELFATCAAGVNSCVEALESLDSRSKAATRLATEIRHGLHRVLHLCMPG